MGGREDGRPSRPGRPARRRAGRWALSVGALVAAVLTACGTTVHGQGVSILFNPNTVEGLPITDGPSGVKPGAPQPTGDVTNTDGGKMDALALLAVNDVADFWSQAYNSGKWGGTFVPISNFVSYDSNDPSGPRICGSDPYGNANAFYCHRNKLMAWDRGELLPIGVKFFGDMSIAALIGHEYGHAIQRMANLVNALTPTIVFEQQADCFAGSYVRWVAENRSKRFSINLGDGLNKVLAAAITIRDPIIKPDTTDLIVEGHGTALDRISAFQVGFTGGTDACGKIDLDEVEKRRGDLPMVLKTDDTGQTQTGEATIDESLVNTLLELLNTQFKPAQPPTLSLQEQPCADAQTVKPATYCPATNTITVDLPELQKLGTPAGEEDRVLIQGDNTALSVLTSRYMLAVQHQRGAAIDTDSAALRTACLTAIAQRDMASPIPLPSKRSVVLSAGDVDEAVAGLLNNGLAASDVNGNTVPAGFTRIMAYRSGLQSDVDACFTRFP